MTPTPSPQCPSLGGLMYGGTVVAELPCQLKAGHELTRIDGPLGPVNIAGTMHRYVVQWAEPVSLQEMALPSCPECLAGKHANCDGVTWDIFTDQGVPCPCATLSLATHPIAEDQAISEVEAIIVAERDVDEVDPTDVARHHAIDEAEAEAARPRTEAEIREREDRLDE